MSKYVNHKYGLILGSDNVFFIVGDEDAGEGVEEFRDGYRAIVWAQGYHFDKINTLNCQIRTPVQQLLWEQQKKTDYIEFEGQKFPERTTYYILKGWPRHWLEANVGAIHERWDVRTHAESNTDCIFFKRRKDALNFIREISTILNGSTKYGY